MPNQTSPIVATAKRNPLTAFFGGINNKNIPMPKQTKTPKDKRKESEIQTECVEWFKTNFPNQIIFSVPLEAARNNWTKFEKMGALRGTCDLVLSLKDHVFFIEMKASWGKISQAQIEFKERCESLGIGYYLCRNLEEFKRAILDQWVKMQKIDPQQHKL